MIVLRDIKDQMVDIYSPDGTLLGRTDNDNSFTDLRVQIKEAQIEGYYVMFQGEKIDITKDGRITTWPNGLFDVNMNLLIKLF